MAANAALIAQISQELLDELTAGGTRDLTEVNLSQMEREAHEAADRVTQRLLQGMLEDQASQARADCCPCCQGPLKDQPPDERPLILQRCQVQWKQPVKRCPKCRRDFFPSGDHDGLSGRVDM